MPGFGSQTLQALSRSLRIYHGDKTRHAAMDALYAHYVGAGGLAFDIGSHVGDRVSSFRRLGARVVALEPQPACARVLRLIHGRDGDVTLVEAACGARVGTVTFHVNSANPTVSTASEVFIGEAKDADGWREQVWDQTIDVPMVTLDTLIARHGVPDFVKIDVEGFEDSVLAGLSTPVPALSFEFTTIQRDMAVACLDRLSVIGAYRFDIALGEGQTLEFDRPVDAASMAAHIAALPHSANSGDVYATLAR